MCNSAVPKRSGQAPFASDASKEGSEDASSSIPLDKVLGCLTSCIHAARVNDILEQKKNLMHIFLISLSAGFPWTVTMSALSSIKELCSRLENTLNGADGTPSPADNSSVVQELLHSVSPKVVECISTVKIAQVHITASECLLRIFKLYQQIPRFPDTEIVLKSELLHQYEVEKNEEAKSLLKNCIDILETLELEKVQPT